MKSINEYYIHDFTDQGLYFVNICDILDVSAETIDSFMPEDYELNSDLASNNGGETWFIQIKTPSSTVTLADRDRNKLIGRAIAEAYNHRACESRHQAEMILAREDK